MFQRVQSNLLKKSGDPFDAPNPPKGIEKPFVKYPRLCMKTQPKNIEKPDSDNEAPAEQNEILTERQKFERQAGCKGQTTRTLFTSH